MNTSKRSVHFTHQHLLTPNNPLTVNLIGVGGTGSQMLTALARIDHSLKKLNHPGLQLKVFDGDLISEANLARQLFSESELGLPKSVALVNRINRFFGSNYKAVPHHYAPSRKSKIAAITISCVDTIKARKGIADGLKVSSNRSPYYRDRAIYWMDLGNARHTGQAMLSTVATVNQPQSTKYRTVSDLPWLTEEYEDLLENQSDSDQPSCSLAEALTKQDLFINSALAQSGASLLWSLFRKGLTFNRGFFMNLQEFRLQPVPVGNTL